MSTSSSDETYDEAAEGTIGDKQNTASSSPTSSLGECTICSEPAHGLHFGVLACRACAAFYRRTVVLSRNYNCRRANKNCTISKEERYLCRYCRFQKCIAVGMQADNVQWKREKKGNKTKKDETEKKSSSLGEFIGERGTQMQDEFIKSLRLIQRNDEAMEDDFVDLNVLDVGEIIVKVAHMFENPPILPNVGIRLSLLQRMTIGINYLRRDQNPNPPIIMHMESGMVKKSWEQQLYNVAEWAMHLDEFVNLPGQEKLVIYRANWGPFHRLERVHQSTLLYGPSIMQMKDNNELIFAIHPEFSINFGKTTYDFSFITDYDSETVLGMFRPFITRLFDEVAKPMAQLLLTDTELAFLLGQLVWHLEGRKVSKETLQVSETLRARISDELHEYYIYEMKIANYAGRLQKIMGMMNDVENILYERAKVLELARIFDVFKITVSDTEIHPQSGR